MTFYKNQCVYNAIKHENRLKREFKVKVNPGSDNYGTQKDYVSEVKNDSLSWPRSIIEQTSVIGNSKEKVKHPTQKPVALFEYLIKTYTNENEIILDNTAGSGTTAIAAINTNRKWVCIEKEKEYYDLAIKRIIDHTWK